MLHYIASIMAIEVSMIGFHHILATHSESSINADYKEPTVLGIFQSVSSIKDIEAFKREREN